MMMRSLQMPRLLSCASLVLWLASGAFAAPAAVASAASAASSPASAPPAQAQRKLVYEPQYLPREVTFAPEQLDHIREAVARQMVTYHSSLAVQNQAWLLIQHDSVKDHRSATEYAVWARTHTEDVYRRHALFSTIIFWFVLLMVSSGLALTWYQFLRDASTLQGVVKGVLKKAATDGAEHSDASSLTALADILRAEQSIELSKDGMKLKTRIVGLVTLVISMGFFYLYLHYVYPVTVNKTAPDSAASAASGGASAPKAAP